MKLEPAETFRVLLGLLVRDGEVPPRERVARLDFPGLQEERDSLQGTIVLGKAAAEVVEDLLDALTRTFAGRGAETMRLDAELNARQRMARDILDLRANFGRRYNEGSLGAIEYAKTLLQFRK